MTIQCRVPHGLKPGLDRVCFKARRILPLGCENTSMSIAFWGRQCLATLSLCTGIGLAQWSSAEIPTSPSTDLPCLKCQYQTTFFLVDKVTVVLAPVLLRQYRDLKSVIRIWWHSTTDLVSLQELQDLLISIWVAYNLVLSIFLGWNKEKTPIHEMLHKPICMN